MNGRKLFMNGRRLSSGLRAALAIFAVTLFVTSTWAAPWERVLYSFNNGADGGYPQASLVMDTRGNLYGTTYGGGGAYGKGTVFQLSHKVGGGWAETVLYSFCSQEYCGDGANPRAGLIFDAAGHLYGTTQNGRGGNGYGVVFELRQQGVRLWTEKGLHGFSGLGDGGDPTAGLIFDAAGNLYGTTVGGGAYFGGTVFELSPTASGGWTYKVLHSFAALDQGPWAGVIIDSSGNLYGTTSTGGAYGYGKVFELSPQAGGGWMEQVLYSFNGGDGSSPFTGLIFDTVGNLYGTTGQGGAHGMGTVFELTPGAGGWTEQLLHDFNGSDGSGPSSGLTIDAYGNLYGTTGGGGTYGNGTVFELLPQAGGGWTEKVLHSFHPKYHNDGVNPDAGLIMDAHGNLYGTTYQGGAYGYGTVFEITP
jgi:uncharacterized repeat protein (TIGR03803 family)